MPHISHGAAEYGFTFDGPLRVDMARVQARAAAVSAKSRGIVEV